MIKHNRKSLLTGKLNCMELPITREALAHFDKTHRNGGGLSNDLVDRWFPALTEEEKSFVLTGATPEEWAAVEFFR